ncbi:hypothetical protein QBE52_10945 [Clostridiaceae bacterium 35-E11]
MLNFLNVSKKNITVLENNMIHMNAHFITDTSQAWIFSNIKEEEGVCEVYLHYISPENNQKMLMEQPLWKAYIGHEIKNEGMRKKFLENICQPMIHVILNVHQNYKYLTNELIEFIYGTLKKKNINVEEILIDTFIYTEVAEMNTHNI